MDHSDQTIHKMVLRVLVFQYQKEAKGEGITTRETEMMGYFIRRFKTVKYEWLQLKYESRV